MSFYGDKLLIPDEYLRPEYREESGKTEALAMLNDIPGIETSIISDYDMWIFWQKVLIKTEISEIHLSLKQFIPIYLENITLYVKHRMIYISNLLYTRQRWMSTIKYMEDFGAYVPPDGSRIMYALTTLWSYSPPVCIYYFWGVALLVFIWRGQFISRGERYFLSIFLILCMLVSLATLLLALSPQVRYIASYFLLIYYASLHLLGKFATHLQTFRNAHD